MSRYAYVNGNFTRFNQAKVHIEDRGLQFGDSVYEVWAAKDGVLLDDIGHLHRLSRSLGMLRIELPLPLGSLKPIIGNLLRLNRVKNGLVYLQITRGVAPRDHPFPKNATPTIIITVRPKNYAQLEAKAQKGIKIVTKKDLRWKRVDIKTTNLLPNLLAKQEAIDEGAEDVWFFDDNGKITEGSAQNAWILNKEGNLQTRGLGEDILGGITRSTIMALAKKLNLKIVEKPFSVQEAIEAREAFVTSATSFVTAVVEIDGRPIGNGNVGSVATILRKAYFEN
ncbi:MAG: D-alanine transaminase [Hyphomonadaceae bacterium]|nr:MAG: D-alanine transaminase [Hyphomonadaceae bacterium]KAF0185348.1 MAG: D-alanine transaminase [Hyphomonadaceae bacterium]